VIPTEEGLCTTAFEPHAGLSSIASHVGEDTGAPLTSTAMFVQVTLPFGGSWPHLGEMEKKGGGGGRDGERTCVLEYVRKRESVIAIGVRSVMAGE
jgi:hypothetical protein